MTLIYQIDSGRRRLLGAERCAKIKVVCSDMWKPYLNVIATMLPAALNVLDRFHIVKKLGEALDKVRRQEARQLAAERYQPVLKNSRYCFLKRPGNFTTGQAAKLGDLLKYDLKTVRAWMLKEPCDAFWQYHSPRWYLKKWRARAVRSRLEPMKKIVRTLRNHEELLMNYFKPGKHYNSGIARGAQPADQPMYEKSLWIPQLRVAANHSVSYAWKTSRAEIHPQAVLKSQKFRWHQRPFPENPWTNRL